MTKQILHAIKKLLRIGVVVATITSGSINASAEGNPSGVCAISCNSQLEVSLDGSGYSLVSYPKIGDVGVNESCFSILDRIVVEIVGSDPVYLDVTQDAHTVATTSALLDYTFVNQNVVYNLMKYYSDGRVDSCQGSILIEDKMKPEMVCSDLKINCTENYDPYQLANTYRNSIPTTTDNYGTSTLAFQDSAEDFNCINPGFFKKIIRVWAATDESGNQQTCTQNILVEKVDGSKIQFPTHTNNIIAPALGCSNKGLEPTNTGYPTLFGVNITDQDLCHFSSFYQDQTISNGRGSFELIRNWTVVDWCTNEIFTHQQIIKTSNKVALKITYPIASEVETRIADSEKDF